MNLNIETVTRPATDDASSNVRSWKIFADLINGIWRKGAADYITCGRYLIEAKDELQRDAYSAMLKKLHFDPSVAKKLSCSAKNVTLGAHVHQLPPCWSTIYELSKLDDNLLKDALADGSIHPGMMRKDAIALKPAKETATKTTTAKTSSSTNPTELSAVWQATSQEQRQVFFDQLGREGLCAAMSPALLADLRDHIINLNIVGASKATYSTMDIHQTPNGERNCQDATTPEHVK